MTFWELLAVVLSSAALFAAILWAFVSYAVRNNVEANKELMRVMNRRADERHREVIEAISALRTT